MKATIIAVIFTAIFSTVNTSHRMYEPKNATAEVDTYEGVYVFTDSKPVKEYDYLGTVKIGFTVGSGQYQDLRDKLIKKAKKEYPSCQGLLFNFKDGGADKADVIKFK